MSTSNQPNNRAGGELSLDVCLKAIKAYFDKVILEIETTIASFDWSMHTQDDGSGNPRFAFLDKINITLSFLSILFDSNRIKNLESRRCFEKYSPNIRNCVGKVSSSYSSLNMCLRDFRRYQGVRQYLHDLVQDLRDLRDAVSPLSETSEASKMGKISEIKEILNDPSTNETLKNISS